MRSEQGGTARLVTPRVAVVVFGIEVDGELLVAIDIREPWRHLWAMVARGSDADELVTQNLLGCDDIDHGSAAAVAGRGVGDDLDAGYAVGWEGLDVLAQILATEVRWAVVDPHLYAL